MKNVALVAVAALTLTACGTSGGLAQYQKYQKETYERQSRLSQQAVEQAPIWMTELPRQKDVVFETGTAVSQDFSMADMKAKTMAYAKICKTAGGTVRSQMKMYRNDSEHASMESSELTVRSICPDVDITGVETVDVKHVAEGNRVRTYVLVALPIGSNNVQKSAKQMQERVPQAFDELDTVTNNKPTAAPSAKATTGNQVPVTNPDGTKGTVALLPVDNTEYKAKRDVALQKPGAVVGQATVPM